MYTISKLHETGNKYCSHIIHVFVYVTYYRLLKAGILLITQWIDKMETSSNYINKSQKNIKLYLRFCWDRADDNVNYKRLLPFSRRGQRDTDCSARITRTNVENVGWRAERFTMNYSLTHTGQLRITNEFEWKELSFI